MLFSAGPHSDEEKILNLRNNLNHPVLQIFLFSSEELISFQKKEIWKMNAVQYLKKDILIGNDSLCCGTAGWIDYLASCHKNEEWSDELFKKIIFSINEQGYVFNGLEGVNEISLFKGMSGIGYSVLRYMGKYPSVLL